MRLSAPLSGGRRSKHHFDFGVAFAREKAHRDALLLAAEEEVEAAGADLQAAYFEPVEERRQARAVEGDHGAVGVDLEAEAGLEKRERRARGPSLRRAGDRIEGRRFVALPVEAAEQLGQAAKVHVRPGVEQGAGEPERLAGV